MDWSLVSVIHDEFDGGGGDRVLVIKTELEREFLSLSIGTYDKWAWAG